VRAAGRTVQSPRPFGERVRGGEHAAKAVIPFTSRPLLLFHSRTGERARVAQSPPPWLPGLPARKSPLRGALSLFPPAIGSGAILHPCRSHPLGASMRLAPACGQRFGDFQPDQGARCRGVNKSGYLRAVGFLFYRGMNEPFSVCRASALLKKQKITAI